MNPDMLAAALLSRGTRMDATSSTSAVGSGEGARTQSYTTAKGDAKFYPGFFVDKSPTGYTGLANQGKAPHHAAASKRRYCCASLRHRPRSDPPLPALAPPSLVTCAGASCYLNSIIQSLYMTP